MVQDLGEALCKWRGAGESLVLFINANKDMMDGYMQQMLLGEGLNMREVAMARHPHLPKTSTFMHGD